MVDTTSPTGGGEGPDGGRVEALGLDPQRDVAAIRQRVGTQLQAAVPPDRLKVWEALDLYATFDDDPADTQQRLLDWDLVDKRDAAFDSLSGGQRQRLFIALALIGSPELVFLDELTNRARPPGATPHVGPHPPDPRPRRDRRAGHPLHGRGRGIVRPDRRHRRRPGRGARHARQPDAPGHRGRRDRLPAQGHPARRPVPRGPGDEPGRVDPDAAGRLTAHGRMRRSSQTLSTREVEVLRRAYDKLGVSDRTAAS